MIVKTKKVYYCEFCKKRSLRSLEKHERHCTLNPNRTCRLCGRESILELIARYKNTYKLIEKTNEGLEDKSYEIEWIKKPTLDEIMDSVELCPTCTLTILRLSFFEPIKAKPCYETVQEIFKFDYKKALQEWWDAKNEDRDDYHGDY
jgi:hypothetical protein